MSKVLDSTPKQATPESVKMTIIYSPFGFVHRLDEGESIEDYREDND